MSDDNRLMVGVDICEDFVQLAYCNAASSTPESVSRGGSEEQYLIPTRLALRISQHEWIIGEDVEKAEKEEIAEVCDFFNKMVVGGKFSFGGEEYSAGHLMQIFLRRVLNILSRYYPYKEVGHISFTFPVITKELVEVMTDAMGRLKVDRERYSLLNHDDALLYYTINQKKELWINDTAVFELEDDELRFRLLNIDQSTKPMTARIRRREVTDKLTKSMVRNNKEVSAGVFQNLALMALEGSIVSTIYAVGRGFFDNWADGTLKKISPGKRAFRGQNLYAYGACFEAKDRKAETQADVVLLGEDRTTVGISITAVKDGREREVVLLKPALKWYEAETEADIIIKGEDELCIQIKDFVTKNVEQRFISFLEINGGKEDITRIRLSLKFKGRDMCIIKAADLGFGGFVPTTNRVWELTWEK